MNTSTRITASILDAFTNHPLGFTLDVNTGEVVTHGMAVGGYHQEDGNNDPHWLEVSTGGVVNGFAYPVTGKSLPFTEIHDAVEEYLDIIRYAGYVGGWVVTGTLVLDIVKLYPCISHTEGIADATAFLEGSRLDQEAIGWLCPQFEGGYKEVGVNF